MASLKAKKRDVLGKKVKQLRAEGLIPASIYGPKTDPVSITIDPADFKNLFSKVGYSALFELKVGDNETFKTLVKEVQRDYLKDVVLHVSFYQVDMTSEINADIPVIVEGESMAVKNNIGLLVTPVTTVTVHCLPGDLPSELTINVSNLNEIGDSIMLNSIELPKGVELEANMSEDSLLAYIAAPQKAIEDEPVEEEVVEGEEGVEGVESEEGIEGEAAEGGASEEAAE